MWWIATQPNKLAHFALMPTKLAAICILAGCRKGGVVLDPFGGAGTTSLVAERLQRQSIYIDASEKYMQMAIDRITDDAPLFAEAAP